MRNLLCYDDTLRDGEQQVGVFFNSSKKKELVRDIVDAGIDQVILMPIIHRTETKLVKELVDEGYKDHITVTTMIRRGQIERAYNLGVRRAIPFGLVSDRFIKYMYGNFGISKDENLQDIKKIFKFAHSLGFELDFAAVDATFADMPYLVKLLREIRKYVRGGTVFFADTVGGSTPKEYGRKIKQLIENVSDGFKIGVHNHNDRGNANDCTVEGVIAGAEAIDTTIGGIGDRAGNADTIKVLYKLKKLGIFTSSGINYNKLSRLRKKVYRYGGSKPAVPYTPEAFWHEAGAHADWLEESRKREEFHSPFLSEYYGQKDVVFFGKQSGIANFKFYNEVFFENFGKKFTNDQYREMRDQVKELSIAKGRSFTIDEVVDFIRKDVINPYEKKSRSSEVLDPREVDQQLYTFW